jgi:hypothetical protein
LAGVQKRGETAPKGDAMRANDLLLWLSERQMGSWRQFRGAVQAMCESEDTEIVFGNSASASGGFPLHQQLRLDFQRLAHVEFFARECESGWRAAPPVLAATRHNGRWLGVLCGARCDALMERFRMASAAGDFEAIRSSGGVDVLRVYATHERDLERVAAHAKIRFQRDASLAILSHLPLVRAPRREDREAEFPEGADWHIHEFVIGSFTWKNVARDEASASRTGLFRFSIHFQPYRYFLRWDRSTYEVRRAIGIYALLGRRRRQVIEYRPATQTLIVPAGCRPMPLLERALVLCSGLIPAFDPRSVTLTYAGIPEETAALARQLLCGAAG